MDNFFFCFCYIFSIPKSTTKKKKILLHFSIQKVKRTTFFFFLLHFLNTENFITFSLYRSRKKQPLEKHVFVTFSQYRNGIRSFAFFCYIFLYKKKNGHPKKKFCYIFSIPKSTTKKKKSLLHFSIQKIKWTNFFFFLLHFLNTKNSVTFSLYRSRKKQPLEKSVFVTFSQYRNGIRSFGFFCYTSLYKKKNGHPKKKVLLHFPNHRNRPPKTKKVCYISLYKK